MEITKERYSWAKYLLISITAIFFSTNSVVLQAQPNQSTSDTSITSTLPAPYTQDFIKRALEKNTLVFKSNNGMAFIPKHIIYKSIFAELIRNKTWDNSFTQADINIIENLLSPSDEHFVSKEIELFSAICDGYSSKNEVSAIGLKQFAQDMESAKINHNKELDEYYLSAVNSLSSTAKNALFSIEDSLAKTEKLGYSTIDSVGMQEDVPLIFKNALIRFCGDFSMVQMKAKLRKVLLKDEDSLSRSIPMVSN